MVPAGGSVEDRLCHHIYTQLHQLDYMHSTPAPLVPRYPIDEIDNR